MGYTIQRRLSACLFGEDRRAHGYSDGEEAEQNTVRRYGERGMAEVGTMI